MPPSCAYVIVRPLGPSISAGLSPNAAACSSTNDGSDVDGISMSGRTLRNTIDGNASPSAARGAQCPRRCTTGSGGRVNPFRS